jgi:hypothetical protein
LLALVLGTVTAVRGSLGASPGYSRVLTNVGIVGASGVVVLFLASMAVVAWLGRARRTASPDPTPEDVSDLSAAGSLHDSFERLTIWLTDDAPIVRNQDDAFGHRRIARRIASRLVEERPPSQAVVGKFGAGKTSLHALVVAALETSGPHARHVHVVRIELWPFETPRAAVEGVIRAVVNQVSREVNVVALRGLPESYVDAMSAAGGIWSTIARVQGTPTSPLKALERIDDIATAIGHRFVVWVEDLERFAGCGGDSVRESPEEAERLNPIRALLYGLDRLKSVTVVTATTSLGVRFDLEKIARYVETLPELADHQVARVVATFRNGCRERYDVIDPAEARVRKELDALGDQQQLKIQRAIRQLKMAKGVPSLPDALATLCSTPRALKQALRAALDTWSRLPGEIDFDDLLLMSILREAQPDVFALVGQHVDALRGRGFSADDARSAREAWDAALKRVTPDDRTRRAIVAVIKFVFDDYSGEIKPQGLKQSGHVEYWERFLSVPILPEVEKDQNVLRVVRADDDGELVRLLEDGGRSGAVESFARLLSTDRLRRLLVPLIRRRCAENPADWGEGNPPGMIPLWRMWLRRSERGELAPSAVLEGVRQALAESVPRQLYLAVWIEDYFVFPSDTVHHMLGTGGTSLASECKQYLRDLIVTTYAEKPDALADAVVGAPVPTLLWACWGIDRVRAGTMAGLPFASWPRLAATILDAARRRPVDLLPQIAGLVSHESVVVARSGEPTRRYDFDAAAAANLFGSPDAVLDVFELQSPSQWPGIGHVEAVFKAVQQRRRPRPGESDSGESLAM